MDSTRGILLEEVTARVVPKGRRLGLVIGIDAYAVDSGIPPLRAAVADAQAIHRVMVDPECGCFPDSHAVMLTDEQATDTNIRIALERLRKDATPEDEVWFFYAGHALIVDGEHRLLPVNARRDYLDATSVDFPSLFRKVRCRRKIVFLDCCHAGATDTSTRNVHDVDDVLRNYDASGTITYCSSDGDQKSVELEEQGHGAFTYWLEKGLRGAADVDGTGVVTSDELWKYVSSHVERDAQRLTGLVQTPRLKLDSSGSFALSVNAAAVQRRAEARSLAESARRAEEERVEMDVASLRQLLGDDDVLDLTTDEVKAARNLLRNHASDSVAQGISRALGVFRSSGDRAATVFLVRGALSSMQEPKSITAEVERRVRQRLADENERRSGTVPAAVVDTPTPSRVEKGTTSARSGGAATPLSSSEAAGDVVRTSGERVPDTTTTERERDPAEATGREVTRPTRLAPRAVVLIMIGVVLGLLEASVRQQYSAVVSILYLVLCVAPPAYVGWRASRAVEVLLVLLYAVPGAFTIKSGEYPVDVYGAMYRLDMVAALTGAALVAAFVSYAVSRFAKRWARRPRR
jgi:uncharacterized caspase-like protein